jgi:hypothetical protein
MQLILPMIQRDGVNVYCDHCHYRPDGHEYFAKPVADFLLREVIAR